MQNSLLSLALALLTLLNNAWSQQTTLLVSGRNLISTSGQTIILRGINYPILDHGSIDFTNHSEFQSFINQAALTGANSIRISWYTDGTHWRDNPVYGGAAGTLNGYVQNGHLNALISYCISKNLIPILDVHNLTCTDDWAGFDNVAMAFWQSSAVQTLIQNNKSRLIINLANELGQVRWASGSQTTALANYVSHYTTAVQQLRNLNITIPLMIDAPDCGQSSTELLSVAEGLNNADPLHNLIFSAHAYWGGYAQTLAEVQTKLNEAQNTNVCFVLGEVAANQDNNNCGDLDLSTLYPLILQEVCSRNIGYLIWTYELDCSSGREMTTDGNFQHLTTFGNDVVYNANYGFLSGGGCAAMPVSVNNISNEPWKPILISNSSGDGFRIETNLKVKWLSVSDISGREISVNAESTENFRLINAPQGCYFVKMEGLGGELYIGKISF
jgi:mannan endo-1,4-beta-mannosidase